MGKDMSNLKKSDIRGGYEPESKLTYICAEDVKAYVVEVFKNNTANVDPEKYPDLLIDFLNYSIEYFKNQNIIL
jgi:hypothetical protein